VDDREEIVITRAGHDPVVMVAFDDYQSLKETDSPDLAASGGSA
jgi:antitoxin YefM